MKITINFKKAVTPELKQLVKDFFNDKELTNEQWNKLKQGGVVRRVPKNSRSGKRRS